MPFTVSHALAVLPVATGRPGQTFVPAALVIGSMIPDLPYFVPPHRGSDWSHAASGPFSIDLVLGLVVFTAWHLVLRRPLVDLAPRSLAERLPGPRRLTGTGWLLAAVSVVIGALTHVVWDTFTHPHRWGTDHVAALQLHLGPLPAYTWLQFASGVLGLVGLALWARGWLRRQLPRPVSPLLSPAQRGTAWVLLAVVFGSALALRWFPAVRAGRAFAESVAFGVATTTISATAAALVALCLGWQLRRVLGSGRRVVGQGPADPGQR